MKPKPKWFVAPKIIYHENEAFIGEGKSHVFVSKSKTSLCGTKYWEYFTRPEATDSAKCLLCKRMVK